MTPLNQNAAVKSVPAVADANLVDPTVTHETPASADLGNRDTNSQFPNYSLSPTHAAVVVLLDPRAVRPSRFPNRDESSFDSEPFDELKHDIVNAGGNAVPVLARLLSTPEGGFTHELTYGARRHRACLEASLPLRAIVDGDKSLAASFLETVRENQNRADLSPWEFGRQMKFALDQGLFTSIRRIAAALGRNISDISRAIQLASLPSEIVAAFQSSSQLQYRHAKPLTDAMDAAADAVIAEARSIINAGMQLGPKEVVDRLLAASGVGVGRSNTPTETVLECEGQRFGKCVIDKDGLVEIRLETALDEKQRSRLHVELQAFYRRSVLKLPRAVSAKKADAS